MYEEYFEQSHVYNDISWQTTLPSFFRMNYQPPFMSGPMFETPLFKKVETVLSALHDRAGNAVTEDKTLILGFGSTQVIRSLLAAAASLDGKPRWVYARDPYYPTFKAWAAENPAVTKGMTSKTNLPNDGK
jgi:hypothetical protein